MKTVFDLYNEVEISKELRAKIRDLKNQILKARYPNGGFTTEDHEKALEEACLQCGVVL
jgi:HEPN domain-containing protein